MDIQFSSRKAIEFPAEVLAVGAGEDWKSALAPLDATFDGHLSKWLDNSGFTGKTGSVSSLPTLGHIAARQLIVVGTGAGSPRDRVEAAGHAGREARRVGAESLALDLGPLDEPLLTAVIEVTGAGNYAYDPYKDEASRKAPLSALTVIGGALDVARTQRATKRVTWQSWARDLVNAPPDELYPATLAEAARGLERFDDVSVEVWDLERCAAEQCVGILAVGRGSARPGCLIRASYAPSDAVAHVALVGKGVTFDSGGLSLKTTAGMIAMKCDMGGAATVLGALGAIADLGLPVAVDCFVGAVENMNDGSSYKLGDILRYANGVTVEIHNTDAEGRLVLADCLIQASRTPGVTHVIDAATLTGAAAVALGPDFAGLFTEDDGLSADLLAAADANGEGMWRLPLHAPYKKMLQSDNAQIKNVGGREGGASTAALFLQHFVDGPAWAHLDIAPSAFVEKPNRYFPTGATGEMVRTLVTWAERLG